MFGAIALLGLTLLAILMLVIPGWLILRPWLPEFLAVGAAPGFTLIVIATLALAVPQVATQWGYLIVGGVFFALILVSELLNLIANRKFGHKTAVRKHRMRASAVSFKRRDWIGIGVGMVMAYVPAALAIRTVDQPAQAWDAMFHQSAIATMRATGSVASIGGLEPLMGRPGLYYPTGAEAFAALVPGNPVSAYNAASLAMLLLFPLLIATLVKTLVPHARYAVGLSAFIAGGIKSFTAVTTLVAVLGYIAGLITATAALALLVYLVKNRLYNVVPFTIIFIIGTAIVHGSAAFGLLVAGTPLVILAWVDLCKNVLPSRWKPLGWFIGAVILIGGPMFTWLARRPLAAVFHYQRPSLSFAAGLSEWPLDIASVATSATGLWGSVFVAIFGVIGYFVWARGWTRIDAKIGICLGISLLLTVLLVVVSMGPENILRVLTAPWYRQGARLGALAWILTLVGVGVGFRWLERMWDGATTIRNWVATGWQKGPVVILAIAILAAITPLTQVYGRYDVVAREYRPEQIRWGTMATTPQLQLIKRTATDPSLNSALAGRLILADPKLGGTLFYTRSGMRVLYPQLNSVTPKRYQPLLKALEDGGSAAQICAQMADIGYVYKVDLGPELDQHRGLREGMKPTELQPLINRIPDTILSPVLDTGDGAHLLAVNCPSKVNEN